jgi:hypothetical protein
VRIGDAAVVPHVRVDTTREGLDIGSELARCICRDARAQGVRVLGLCPFMRRWAPLHPQFGDVLRAARPGEIASTTPMVRAVEYLEDLRLATSRAG